MNYATVVPELFSRFPGLEATYHAKFAYMADDEGDSLHRLRLNPHTCLNSCVEEGNSGTILPICAFLEDASVAAHDDNFLATLLRVEVAEWLGWASNEERLAPWLGAETRRFCNYVPGLATQRLQLRSEEKAETISARLAATFGGHKLP